MILDSVGATASDPSSRSAADQERLEEDLNKFLTLLVTQLQNQDPLDPMDTNEFTSQLVQFASVEQQIQQNANLEAVLRAERGGQAAAAVGYIGTLAEIDGNTLPLETGFAEASYTLGENAHETVITVRDVSGKIVHSTSGETAAGRHLFQWDGLDDAGEPLPDGAYTLEIAAVRQDGEPVAMIQSAFGRVDGTAVEGGTLMLLVGDLLVPVDHVLSVREAPPPAGDGS